MGDDPQLLSSYHEMQNRLLKKGCVRYAKEWSPFSDLSANKTWLECLAGIWPKNLKRCAAVSYFPTFFCARKLILYSVFLTKRARAWVSITRFAKASLLWPPYSRNCCRVPCITGCPGKICMLKLIFLRQITLRQTLILHNIYFWKQWFEFLRIWISHSVIFAPKMIFINER